MTGPLYYVLVDCCDGEKCVTCAHLRRGLKIRASVTIRPVPKNQADRIALNWADHRPEIVRAAEPEKNEKK